MLWVTIGTLMNNADQDRTTPWSKVSDIYERFLILLTMKPFYIAQNGIDIYLSLTFHSHYTTTLKPFLNKPWFLRVCSTSLLKTLREKEKLMSNFSFSHSVFYPFG